MDDLRRLGWDARWAQAAPAGAVVRILAEHRGAYHVVGDGGVGWAELTGKRFHAAKDKRDLPTVGDWVGVDRWSEALAGNGAATIREILPRRTLLVRKAAGEKTAPQPLAANVDLGLIVTSANMEMSPRRLERYLAVLRDAQVTPVIVLNKIDLVRRWRRRGRIDRDARSRARGHPDLRDHAGRDLIDSAHASRMRPACCSVRRASASRRCSTA